MSEIVKLQEQDLRVSLFAPLERNTPIVEVLYGDKILLDLSFSDDDPKGDIFILFHVEISGVSLQRDSLQKLLQNGTMRLTEV